METLQSTLERLSKTPLNKYFYYDCNNRWGWINTIDDLYVFFQAQLKDSCSIKNIKDFLVKSRFNKDNTTCGTRIEHTGSTLFDHLTTEELGSFFMYNFYKNDNN